MLTDDQKAELIKSLIEEDIPEDEMITDYIVIAGTRNLESGGGSYMVNNMGPAWAIEGLLRRGLSILHASIE